jgi:hypothetical protein
MSIVIDVAEAGLQSLDVHAAVELDRGSDTSPLRKSAFGRPPCERAFGGTDASVGASVGW